MQEHGFDCYPTGRILKRRDAEIEYRIRRDLKQYCAVLCPPGLKSSRPSWDRSSSVFENLSKQRCTSKAYDTFCRLGSLLAALGRCRSCFWASRFGAGCLRLPWLASGLLLLWMPGAWLMQQRRGDYMMLVFEFDAGGSTPQLADTLATAAEHTREGCTVARSSLLRIRRDGPTSSPSLPNSMPSYKRI